MSKFSLPSGTTYSHDNSGNRICTGSQMGRGNILPVDRFTASPKMRLIRLPFVDGDYDRWGAYWGSPSNVWCACGDWQDATVQVFVRADSREQAKRMVRESIPNARFYR